LAPLKLDLALRLIDGDFEGRMKVIPSNLRVSALGIDGDRHILCLDRPHARVADAPLALPEPLTMQVLA
jgi:hypothetical protein